MKIKLIIIIILLLVFCCTKNYSKEFSIKNNTKTKLVSLLYEDKSLEVPIDDYVFNVLACEMPASFHEEALKAGAVAIRTFYLYKENKDPNYIANSIDQCYITNESLKEKWKDKYDYYYDKLKNIVEETKNEYLSYNNEVILALYYSISNGYTENVKDVFSMDIPYLISVDSLWDKELKNYKNEYILPKEKFLEKLDLNNNEELSIKIISYTEGKSIKEIKINNKLFSGIEIRKKLNLRSTDFDIEVNENSIKITTRGYGHGVGMSQYGSNEMAKSGKKYDEILIHYYPGTKINNINV